jgi:hypothetical protein
LQDRPRIGWFRLGVTGLFVKKTDIYRHSAWPRDAVASSPPGQIGTVEVGKQASGMAINHAGKLALVATAPRIRSPC